MAAPITPLTPVRSEPAPPAEPPAADSMALGPIVKTLTGAMDRLLTQDTITPQVVNAACNVASQVTQMAKVQLEFLKFKAAEKRADRAEQRQRDRDE